MIIRRPEAEKKGCMALIYGDTGVGKTVSTLLTCPKPALYIEMDPKPVERTAGWIVDFTDIEIIHPEGFMDFFEYMMENTEEITKKFRTIIIDPLSYLINVILLGEIEEESARAGIFAKANRPLMSMGKTDFSGYGAVASLAKRVCRVLGNYAIGGLLVVCIALLDENPRWNAELAAAPAFVGKDFNKDYPAYFDIIGIVLKKKKDDKGDPNFPIVIFHDEMSNFICKWSGPRGGKGPIKGDLNWERIVKMRENSRKE